MVTEDDTRGEQRDWKEELTATGEDLLERVKALAEEGTVRRIIIKQGDRRLVELPLTVGLVGALLAPQLAAVSAIAALVAHCTISVERETTEPDEGPPPSSESS